MVKLPDENYNDGYYHVSKDLRDYPNLWLYVVWSRRGPGKTYSFLYHCIKDNIKFLYLKRTKEDVNFLCTKIQVTDDPEAEPVDPDPFAPINEDHGTNIHIFQIKDGMAGFWECNEEGERIGNALGYCIAFSLVSKLKGFNMRSITEMCYDEFIPQPTEVVRRSSGRALLALYMTVNRDREKRGFPPLKLIMFANAEEISTYETNILEITDDMAELEISGKTHFFNKDRMILLHHITEDEIPITEEEQGAIYKGMAGTAWHDYAFGGHFANNDFTNVKKISLKGYKCLIHLRYQRKDIYIYFNYNSGKYYMCYSPNKAIFDYDLEKENDQKLFYVTHYLQLDEALINGRMSFQKYSMYDIIKNYSKFFKI